MNEEIRRLRQETGLSQSKFGSKLHIPVKTLQKWEQGISAPPEHVIYMIERILSLEQEISRLSRQEGENYGKTNKEETQPDEG